MSPMTTASRLRARIGQEKMRDVAPLTPAQRFNRATDDVVTLVQHTV